MSGTTLALLARGFAHAAASDEASLRSLERAGWPARPGELLAHVLGAEEVWLARVEGRAPRAAVWPEPEPAALARLAREVGTGWARLVEGLDEAGLARRVAYVNSAGQGFENALGDLLLHVLLHGHWHRGQVALLLREAGHEPAPQDYVGWVRGVPAATRPDAAQRPRA